MQAHRVIFRTAVAFALLLPSFAYPQQQREPFSPAEVQAARDAMKSILGDEPVPAELIWSNKVTYPNGKQAGHIAFASPFTAVSDKLKLRRKVSCDFQPPEWRCSLGTDGRIEFDGKEKLFSVRVDARAAADIVDHLFSQCFAGQFSTLTQGRRRPSTYLSYLGGMAKHERGFVLNSGGYEDYILEVAGAKTDGCRFQVVSPVQSPSVEQPTSFNDILMGTLFWVIFGVCLLTYVYPWSFESRASRVMVHLPLSLFALLPLFWSIPMPGVNIRIDLLVFPPLAGIAVICYVIKLFLLGRRRKT